MAGSTPAGTPERTIGIDVGDTWSQSCVVAASGTVIEEARVWTTAQAMQTPLRGAAGPARRGGGGDALALAQSTARGVGP